VIPMDLGWHSEDQLYMHSEQLLNQWLWCSPAGRWCKQNATDLTFKPVMYHKTESQYACELMIYGRLEETDYSYYLLKFKGENI